MWEQTAAFYPLASVPLALKHGSHSANFPSDVQPVAMRYFYSFLFNIPLRMIICFYRVLPRNKGNKTHFNCSSNLALFLSDNREIRSL